jgi:glycosyltransferase involved in cell wall biosynthesis
MRLMQIVSTGGFNGAIKYCREMANQLARRGHDVTVVCIPNSWLARHLKQDGQVRVVESDLHRWPLDELRRIAGIFHQHECDVIHTHNSRAHFFGVLLRYLHRLPCIATAHQNHFQLHWALNDFVIANSAATLRYQRRRNMVLRRRSQLVHYPIDTERFARVTRAQAEAVRGELGLSPEHQAIGIVGNVETRKGHHYLIRALPRLLAAHPNARMVVIGSERPQYHQQLLTEIASVGVGHAVIWAGYRTDIPAVMHALDVCVCAATEEAFGLTAAEALAAGTPVVATKVGGLPESCLHEQTGLLVSPRDPSGLADALIRMLSHPEMRTRMAEAGVRHVEQHFSVEAHYSALEECYAVVAGLPSPSILRPVRPVFQPVSRRAAA